MKRFLSIIALLLYAQVGYSFNSVTFHADSITQDDVGVLRNTTVELDLRNINKPSISIKTQAAMGLSKDFSSSKSVAQGKDWSELALDCDVPPSLAAGTWHCNQGKFTTARIKLPFSLAITPNINAQKQTVEVDFNLQNASFSDEAGLHAADKLTGSIHLKMEKKAKELVWDANIHWLSGEVFWQPFYFANGGHEFQASGKLQEHLLTFDSANLSLKNIGSLAFSGQLDASNYQIKSLQASLPNLNLGNAYPLLFQPLLGNTALNDAEIAGQAALNVKVINNEIKVFELKLDNVDISDKASKFAFYKINANIPWSYDDATQVKFGYEGGQLLNLPLGRTALQAEVNRYSVTADQMTLPILDSALSLSDVSAARIGDQWYWHLRAKVNPISMGDLSGALKLPKMVGKVSAEIPLVTYAAGNLTIDGSMVFNLFSGQMTVTNLSLQTPLGKTPKLFADLQFRRLDLGDLTRTFSFGAIEGKLDGDVNSLEMQNWKPVKFDAKVQSSPEVSGERRYAKKISQRAVENISALGGAGAAAAVQRSFLRFFKEFNYAKLGLSCQLRNDTCKMDGIESTAQGYVIVKGSGIPAITVMGYNRTVGWGELLSRIKRVTDGNAKAVVQ